MSLYDHRAEITDDLRIIVRLIELPLLITAIALMGSGPLQIPATRITRFHQYPGG